MNTMRLNNLAKATSFPQGRTYAQPVWCLVGTLAAKCPKMEGFFRLGQSAHIDGSDPRGAHPT
jgi:hypothetical protein